MADHVPPSKRSAIMRAVPSANTSLELRLRRALWRQGLRYRVNTRVAGVRPDLSFSRARVAIFLDGCFWHGCPLCSKVPKTRTAFWTNKVRTNVDRDMRDSDTLRNAGWLVVRFRECQIKHSLEEATNLVKSAVTSGPLARDESTLPLYPLD